MKNCFSLSQRNADQPPSYRKAANSFQVKYCTPWKWHTNPWRR